MYAGHLQAQFKDFKVTVIRDNAVSHAKSQKNERKRNPVHRRSASDPSEVIQLASSGSERRKKCRWQSAPVKKAPDMAPVLKRSVDGPTVSLASLHVAYRIPVSKKDQPPTFKKSTEKPLSIVQILENIEGLQIDDFSDDFMDKDSFLGMSSTHTV
mmetsp:Transcript_1907/g.3762  ORF Transcript_1907/g.3762 Transcript_1907/m.3762 type:complete len:156 (-) Transcript_1907:295-762(-)